MQADVAVIRLCRSICLCRAMGWTGVGAVMAAPSFTTTGRSTNAGGCCGEAPVPVEAPVFVDDRRRGAVRPGAERGGEARGGEARGGEA